MSAMNEPLAKDAARVKRTGSCFCGAVKYAADGAPLNVRVCHCRDCQRLTGSAFFARALYPKKAVAITGAPAEFASSDDLVRKFCPRCGSQIFAERRSNPDAIAIALGSFDDLAGLAPSEHIWVSDKQPWLAIPAEARQHAESAPK